MARFLGAGKRALGSSRGVGSLGSRVLGGTLFAGMKVGEAFIRGSVSKVWEIRAASSLKGRCERGRMGRTSLKLVLAALSLCSLFTSPNSFNFFKF